MVTDPVVMVIPVSVTNKESVTLSTAPTPHSSKILIDQKSISIYNVLKFNNESLTKIL